MKNIPHFVLAVVVSAALSLPAWAQGRGADSGRGEPHAAPPAAQQTTPATASTPTHAQATAHRRTMPHRDVHRHHADVSRHHRSPHHASNIPPERSNKGGALRGQARAQEVHRMNQEKRAAQKTKTVSHAHHDADATHGDHRHEGKKH
jgi:hypothetical protein